MKINIEESSSESDEDAALHMEVENLPSSDDDSIIGGSHYDEEFNQESLVENHLGEQSELQINTYFAVDYVTKWYIGSVIEVENDQVNMKFLERIPDDKFRWPKRAGIDPSL